MVHILKTEVGYFQAVVTGVKTFEVRLNDRGYRTGDELLLREWCSESQCFTGASVMVTVLYVLLDNCGYLHPGYCVLGICVSGAREMRGG